MIQYLVSNDLKQRAEFVKEKFGTKKYAIYNKIPLRDLYGSFDEVYKLDDLYKDDVFLKLLSKIDKKSIVFFVDLGLDYCSFQANYIKPYTKLHPISQQCNTTYIIDGLAFYNTEKSIYRPFLYINPDILGSSVQEFYNANTYTEFDGNIIENYYKVIKPYIEIKTSKLEVETVSYNPTEKEIQDYYRLKKNVIIDNKFPKIKVVKLLLNYVNNSESKISVIKPPQDGVLNVTENSGNSRIKMYQDILLSNPKKIIFYSSGLYGADEIELSRTRDALIRHNQLIELINGK